MKPEGIQLNVSLKELSWWKVGGEAEYFAAPKSVEELKTVWQWALNEKLPVQILSGGSNVLVRDGKIPGLTVWMRELKGIEAVETGDEVVITCLAGTAKSEVAKIFLQNRLPPAVFLTGIPGDIGGGIVMNAGIGESRVPREFCEIVDSIEVLRPHDGGFEQIWISGSQMKWEYRHSSGWQPGVILRAKLRWKNEPKKEVVDEVRAQTRKRVTTQPLDLPSCGSVFRNPHGHKAAQLIENCGLKGFRIGGATVSPKHANFIVNDQNASSEDIRKIIEHVRTTVLNETGVELRTEVIYFGGGSL